MNATIQRALGGAAAVGLLGGCPIEPEPTGPCSGAGAPSIEVFQRLDNIEVTEGSDLPVFLPPQGGVWTELDVYFIGVDPNAIESLRIEVSDSGGAPLAVQQYSLLPVRCLQDDTLFVDNMPVAFYESTVLDELDGVPATLRFLLTTSDEGEVEFLHAVTLRATDF